MKQRKILKIAIVFFAAICIGLFTNKANATELTGYMGVQEYRESGYGYRIKDRMPPSNGINVWKIVKYPNYTESNVGNIDWSNSIYCIRAGVGFTANSRFVNYTRNYDMKSNKTDVLNILSNVLSNDGLSQAQIESYKSNYNKLLWILDNMYIPSSSTSASDRVKLLSNAEISENLYTTITDEDIEVVQQLVIWYYTNFENSDYHPVNFHTIYLGQNNNFEALSDYGNAGYVRQAAMEKLFNYFITNAEANSNYESTNISPITININNAVCIEENANYKFGPYEITKNSNLPYNASFNFNKTGYVLKDENGNTITDLQTAVNNLAVGSTLKVYAYIPENSGIEGSLQFSYSIDYTNTTATFITTAENTASNEQPLVNVEKTPHNLQDRVSIQIPQKEFDFSLRKFITAINGTPVEISRVPVVDTTPLKNKTGTTAEYKHTKAPLEVQIGDKVTYTIRVYNEGELDGYISEITDYLPEWLDFDLTDQENLNYAWQVENNNRTIKTDITSKTTQSSGLQSELYSSRGNTLLSKYTGGDTLDYIDVKINCVVNDNVTKGTVITNIADVSGMTDASGVALNADRDSVPANGPKLSGDALQNYTGKNNKSDLSDSTYYYKGQEDDDDFEKLIVVIPELDLKLIKNITKVNNEPITERLQSISVSKLNTLGTDSSTTAIYTMDKDPVLVKNGDIITYRLRVYNEGLVDGYAKKITEDIPDGLEYIENDTTNLQYGWSNFERNSQGKIVKISTNHLSRENEVVPGDGSNLIRAFGENDGSKTASNLSFKEVYVTMLVTDESKLEKVIRNEACISEDSDADGKEIDDRDSNPHTWVKYEDDEDYDNIILKPFDLALRKFITAVSKSTTIKPENQLKLTNGKYIREPEVDTSKLNTIENNQVITTAIYNHSKQPIEVSKGDYVVYTIRVYNEGYRDGYASEIKDHLPEYLEYVDCEFNDNFGWDVSEDGRTVTTDYLKNTLLNKAVLNNNPTSPENRYTLDYADVQIMCKVKSTAHYNENITNIADITVYKDENKNVILDRDSEIDNVVLPSDENLPTYKDNEHGSYIPGQQDDDDFDKVIIRPFDLALRKFITAVDDTNINNRYPQVTYNNGKLVYNHTKEPVEVENGNIVTYTIRVYNEGGVAGYAEEVKDDIPEGLEFLPNNSINTQYEWKMYKVIETNEGKEYEEVSDPREADVIITDYLSEAKETSQRENIINPFNGSAQISDTNPHYRDIKVAFKVVEPNTSDRVIINKAEIQQDSDDDIDSIPGEWNDGEDDQDIEKIKVKYFDLALRKFITKVNNTDINNRYPEVSYDEENEKLVYTHTKEPIEVRNGNIVTYTIRVYNEGQASGYAEAVKDDIPEGLEFLPENDTNIEYEWKMYKIVETNGVKEYVEVTNIEEAEVIITDYLSEEKETEDRQNIINPFNGSAQISDTNPYYRDIKVAFKVVEPNTSDRVIINKAEIQQDSDDDIDSIPGEWNDGEDDQDIEKIIVKYFDLALRKWVTQAIVTEDGKTNIYETGHTAEQDPEPIVKVEIKSKKLNKVTVKFKYNIRVTNEGTIAGYAYELKDYIPDGLKFVAEDNPLWIDLGGGVISTTQLENTLLQPGETATVDVILTWINGQDNMGLKVNTAEISKDSDDDIDSTPDNKVPKEDDIDDAPVMLSIKTGEMRIYFLISGIVLITLAGGIILIKKFVL